MASAYATRVSQKLAFARMHLRLWQQTESGADVQSVAMAHALRESALFHAVGAYQVFLQEILHFHGIKTIVPVTLEDVERSLSGKQRTAPEVQELKNLLEKKDSWLSALLLHYEYALVVHEKVEAKPHDVTNPQSIGIALVEADELLLSSAVFEHYLNALSEYINRVHESTMSEW